MHGLRDLASLIRQALFPPDPGAYRLIGAARAALGGLLTLALAAALKPVMPMPFTARVLGFATAMFLGALVRDPTRRAQAWTIAVSPVPVFAAAALVALALPHRWLPELLTIAAVFAAICAASCGPRWTALGAVSLIGLLVALLSHLSPAGLPSRFVVLLLAAASAALVRFAILADRPAAQLRRLRRAVRRGIAGVLLGIETALGHGGWQPGERRRLRRSVARLNEATMLAQPLLAPDAALHLLETDLMVERVSRVALVDLGDAAGRPALLAQLAALRRAALDDIPPPQPPQRQPGQLAGVLAALALLLMRPACDTPASAPPARAPLGRPWATLEVRPAIQAALATLLAIVGGTLVSSNRWYWAVFASFAVFQGTRSRGESAAKAIEMMLGTLAGVVAGVLAATLLHGHRIGELAAIVAGVFMAFLASTAAYGVMVFWLTVILGVVFGMLGYFPPELLLLRLKETAVGAAAGVIVAWIVLARPTPGLVRGAAASFLRALAPVVREAARPLLDQPSDGSLAGLTLALEQRHQALRSAAAPQLPGVRVLGAEQTRRLLLLLSACDEWARELVRTSLHLPPRHDAVLFAITTQAELRIAASIAAVAPALEGHSAAAARTQGEPAAVPAVPEGDDPAIHAAKLLLRLDAALLHLRQRLAV